MSSLIFQISKHQLLAATDTLATSIDGYPSHFTTKAFAVPHLQTVIAGTGVGGFADAWFIQINTNLIVSGIDGLDKRAPAILSAAWEGYKKHFACKDNLTTTVYHFGFSENTGLIHSFAYRSTNSFVSEKLAYGTAVKPFCTVPNDFRFRRDIRELMMQQRGVQRAKPKSEQVYIGGEILLHSLSKRGYAVQTLGQFDDYESHEKLIQSQRRS